VECAKPAQELYACSGALHACLGSSTLTPAQEVKAADTPGTNNGSLLQEYQLPDGIHTADYVATLVTSSFTRLGVVVEVPDGFQAGLATQLQQHAGSACADLLPSTCTH
jgi:hypothetical protein